MRFLTLRLACLVASGLSVSGQNPLAATIGGTPNLGILTINLPANSLAWDPNSQKFYLSLPSADGPNGNAVQVLDPVAGNLGANAFVGSEPDLLSVSANGQYLYVGLNGSSTVQRMTLPNLGLDIKIPLGSSSDGAYYAGGLQASPTADGTVAIVRYASTVSPAEEGGVQIYDNAIQRPNVICGFIQIGCTGNTGAWLFDSIQWNADASVLFGANNEDTGFDFYTVPVTASGFGTVTDYPGLAGGFSNSIHFDRVTGYVYDDNGSIIDPVAGAMVGKFDASGLVAPAGSLGRAFVLSESGYGSYTLTAFDMARLTPIATATIGNVTGTATHLIRWGANGLAFTTVLEPGTSLAGAVYVLSGSFIGPGAAPLISSGGVVPIDSISPIVQSGEWISIYGGNLAGGTAIWSGNFPSSLGGTSVTIDGKNAYLSYVNPWLIDAQVPDDPATGTVSVVVSTSGGSGTSTVTLAPFAPSLPLLDATHVAAIIVRSNGSGAYGGGGYDIVGPTGSSLGYRTVAAKAGDLVSLFAVGLGPTSPFVPPGQPFSGAAATTNTVTLLISKLNVPLQFAGLSSAGLYQLNFSVPVGLGSGDIPLEVVVEGVETPSGAVISLD
jgi:uncharacterized protein (TIGR03437 family)